MESENLLLKMLSNKAQSLVEDEEVSGSVWGMLINDVREKYEESLFDDLQFSLCRYFMNDVRPTLSEKEQATFSENWFREIFYNQIGCHLDTEFDWEMKQFFNNPNN